MTVRKSILLLLISLCGVALYIAQQALDAPKQTQSSDPMVGKTVPQLSITTLQDSDQSLLGIVSQYSKPVLVNIWASWCGVCRLEHPFLMRLASEQGVDIVGVNYRDQLAAAKQTLVEQGNPYQQVLFDPQGQLALELGVIGTPETFVVAPNGEILARVQGGVDPTNWPLLKSELSQWQEVTE